MQYVFVSVDCGIDVFVLFFCLYYWDRVSIRSFYDSS